MKTSKDDVKEFLDGPNVESKLITGARYIFCIESLYSMYRLVCYLVLIGIIFLFSVLPWYILVKILGFEIGSSLFFFLGVIGFFVGLYVAIMLGYYIYISGWQQ